MASWANTVCLNQSPTLKISRFGRAAFFADFSVPFFFSGVLLLTLSEGFRGREKHSLRRKRNKERTSLRNLYRSDLYCPSKATSAEIQGYQKKGQNPNLCLIWWHFTIFFFNILVSSIQLTTQLKPKNLNSTLIALARSLILPFIVDSVLGFHSVSNRL